jgi:Ala-tRNA(Pro) deacylase
MTAGLLEYLQGRGVTFTVIPHAPVSDPAERAATMGFLAEESVRTEVFIAEFGPVLAVVPAGATVDLELVREATGDGYARPATEREMVRSFPEYEPGSLPPLGLLFLAPMYVDPVVMEHPSVVFAAGRSSVSIRMSTRDLFRDDPVVVTSLVRSTDLDLDETSTSDEGRSDAEPSGAEPSGTEPDPDGDPRPIAG